MSKTATAVKPQMTKLAIIDELISNGYAKDPSTRGLSDTEDCIYRADNGNRCAIGKTINNKHIKFVSEIENDVSGLEEELSAEGITLDGAMFKKFRGHDLDFWQELQSFHDNNYNFDEEELSAKGVNNLHTLRERHKRGGDGSYLK